MIDPAPPTARGRRTRESLLRATAELVAERGFHAVGIAEIGAAAGVTGAAIYRHFSNKEAMLVAVFENVVSELLDGARRALDLRISANATLEAFIRAHIAFALANRTVITVYNQESHNLSAAQRLRVRRQQRSYAQLWMDTVHIVHPGWSVGDVSTAVHGVFGLINSVADYRTTMSIDAQTKRLHQMAVQSLQLEPSGA